MAGTRHTADAAESIPAHRLSPANADRRRHIFSCREWSSYLTSNELERRISEPDEIHVLHYIGHGAYDEATERGIVVLESARGRPHDVSGEGLGAMVQDEESLRLVVLNACEGARTSHVDPIAGVAARLVEFEIPAVIGMAVRDY
jgi:hypothetical protein